MTVTSKFSQHQLYCQLHTAYDIASHNDIVLDAAKRGTDLFTRVATPERAALFGAFPLRKWLDYSSPAKQCDFITDSYCGRS